MTGQCQRAPSCRYPEGHRDGCTPPPHVLKVTPEAEPIVEQKEADYLAALVAYWSGRLDGLCAELRGQGWTVERDGLSVTVSRP